MAFINPHTVSNISKENIKAAVIYATHSGNAELVAEAICDGICSEDIKTELLRAEKANANEVSKNDLIVFVCSTYDVGQLNDKFIKFNKTFKNLSLPGKVIEVVGLGDSEYYDIFCGAADILEQTVKKVGGKQLMGTLRVDGPPHSKLHEMKSWGKELVQKYLLSV